MISDLFGSQTLHYECVDFDKKAKYSQEIYRKCIKLLTNKNIFIKLVNRP